MKKSPIKVMTSAALATALLVPAAAVSADAAEVQIEKIAFDLNGEVQTVTFADYVDAIVSESGDLYDFVSAATPAGISVEEGKFVSYTSLVDALINDTEGKASTEILAELSTNEDALVDAAVVANYTAFGEEEVVGTEIASVSAVGVKTVEVKFNGSVDTDAVTVKVKKGAAIYSKSVEWNEAKDTATVTTVIELPAGDYSAEVTGLGVEVATEDFTVAAETASSVELTGATIDDNTAAARVPFVVKNQYGEDMEVTASTSGVIVSAFNVTQNADVSSDVNKPGEQYFEIDTATNADDYKVGDEVRFTATYKGMTTQSVVTVAAPSSSSAIQLGDIVLAEDDLRLNAADGTVKLNYTLLDQYGNAVDFNSTGKLSLPTTLQGVQFISSDSSVISDIQIVNNADGYGEIELTVAGAGTATITTVVNESGAISTKTITVEENAAPEAVAINAPSQLVASQDAAFNLDTTVTDQYGNVVESVTGLAAGIDLAGAVVTLDDTDGVTTLNVDLTGVAANTVNETTSVTITVVNDANGDGNVDSGETELGTLTFDVEPEAVAQEVKAADFAKVFEDSATLSVSNDDLTVIDQYGRSFEGTITITSADSGVVSVANGVDLTAAGVGTTTLTVDVDGKTLDVPVEVIASSDIKSYTMADLGTIYADSSATVGTPASTDYELSATLNGVDAEGNTVVLASNSPDTITTSNALVAAVSGTNVYGVKAGTATISAWKNGVKVASGTVTVSEETPVATSVEFTADNITADTTADLSSIVKVLDQYGVDITASTSLFFAGGTEVATTGTVTDAVDGTDVVETITVITSNGLTATADVTIN